jgi:hypothetical protein
MSSEIDREWEEQIARYCAMSEAEIRALSTGEVIEGFCYTFPEPTPYARAWYEQRAARDRFRMRVKSLEVLVDAYHLGELPSYDIILIILELGRRARDAGYARTGQWLKHAFDRERDRLNQEQNALIRSGEIQKIGE